MDAEFGPRKKWQFLLIFMLMLGEIFSADIAPKKVFAKFGSVRVDYPSAGRQWSSSWPEGIPFDNRKSSMKTNTLLNSTAAASAAYTNYPYKTTTTFSRKLLTPQPTTFSWEGDSLLISVLWPANSIAGTEANSFRATATAEQTPNSITGTKVSNDRAFFENKKRARASTKFIPPLSWLTIHGAKVKVYPATTATALQSKQQQALQQVSGGGSLMDSVSPTRDLLTKINTPTTAAATTADDAATAATADRQTASADAPADSQAVATAAIATTAADRHVEIAMDAQLVDRSIHRLRSFGFQQEDLCRLLDKAPWILAFDLASLLPKLFETFSSAPFSFSSEQVVRLLSHGPLVFAYLARYPGKDYALLFTTYTQALAYPAEKLKKDLIELPSLLTIPITRLQAWRAFFAAYGLVGEHDPEMKLYQIFRRTPVLYYLDPPSVFQVEEGLEELDEVQHVVQPLAVAVAKDAGKILDYLFQAFPQLNIGKLIRTAPSLLLEELATVQERMMLIVCLMRVMMDYGQLRSDLAPSSRTQPQQHLSATTATIADAANAAEEEEGQEQEEEDYRQAFARKRYEVYRPPPASSASSSVSSLSASAVSSFASSSSSLKIQGGGSLTKTLQAMLQEQLARIAATQPQPGSSSSDASYYYPALLKDAHVMNIFYKFTNGDIYTLSIEAVQLLQMIATLEDLAFYPKNILQYLKHHRPSLWKHTPISLQAMIAFLQEIYTVSGESNNSKQEQSGSSSSVNTAVITNLCKCPDILTSDLVSLQMKVQYYQEVLAAGGETAALRYLPEFLAASWEQTILPKCEFLRAFGKQSNPLDILMLANNNKARSGSSSNSNAYDDSGSNIAGSAADGSSSGSGSGSSTLRPSHLINTLLRANGEELCAYLQRAATGSNVGGNSNSVPGVVVYDRFVQYYRQGWHEMMILKGNSNQHSSQGSHGSSGSSYSSYGLQEDDYYPVVSSSSSLSPAYFDPQLKDRIKEVTIFALKATAQEMRNKQGNDLLSSTAQQSATSTRSAAVTSSKVAASSTKPVKKKVYNSNNNSNNRWTSSRRRTTTTSSSNNL